MIRRYGSTDAALLSVEVAGDRSMRRAAAQALGVDHTNVDFRRTAHRESFEQVNLRDGYLYVRNRAVSSRVNGNFDAFIASELATEAPGFGYQTFVGKPVFVNHHNDNWRRARGINIAAALHNDLNDDGTPDTWVELLKEIDAKKFPRLARALIEGRINRTSMGVDVAATKCVNHCGNWATTQQEFCDFIPACKGQVVETRSADGTRHTGVVYEIMAGCSFFEDSLLVEPPADATALVLGVQDHSGIVTS